ncbi:MAG: FAD-dependent oxidoreductase [Leptolyngbya sp. DLM2.Bin27]|nr:MAG: FAD-dependent oxidoreductase [Leptolyngbya sp. DLM2.Bin27]
MEDVVVIGAGLSGLTAARQLDRAGYRVRVVDKSRGLGGRVATRRREATAIDHGCRYLQPFADPSLSPVPAMLTSGILRHWRPEMFELGDYDRLQAMAPTAIYAAPQGMSAIAKDLASGLTICRHWRATAVTPQPQGWLVEGEDLGNDSQPQPQAFAARAVVIAIPAPQVADLIGVAAGQNPAVQALIQPLQAVEFEPVITVMAGYHGQPPSLPLQTSLGGWLVSGETHPALRWAALDSSKRTDAQAPVVVIHSSAAFAVNNFERLDLEMVGQELVVIAANTLTPALDAPAWMQVHRWRYGFVSQPLGAPVLSSAALPTLVGCGDWCLGGNVEGAIGSGQRAAQHIAQALK